MEVRETEEGYLRKFIPLCVVEFFFFIAYIMGFFVATEYGHEAFRGFNKTTPNNSDISHCETNTSSVSYIEEQKVQKEVSNWNVYIFIAQGVPLIFASIVFAPLSDRVGRKIFLVIWGRWSLPQTALDDPSHCIRMEYLLVHTLYSSRGMYW